jgi:ATP-dependent 26S proteasome regulatory subunit
VAFTPRPGRIDKCITLENPTETLRRKLVETVWPEDIRNAIDVADLMQRSDGYSFAELEAIRTFLVTNKTLGSGTWDLNRAFDEFESRRAEKKRKNIKKVGF